MVRQWLIARVSGWRLGVAVAISRTLGSRLTCYAHLESVLMGGARIPQPLASIDGGTGQLVGMVFRRCGCALQPAVA